MSFQSSVVRSTVGPRKVRLLKQVTVKISVDLLQV